MEPWSPEQIKAAIDASYERLSLKMNVALWRAFLGRLGPSPYPWYHSLN